MSALATIKRLLPLLSEAEAAEVLTLLKVRVQLTPKRAEEREPDWLLYGINEELKRRGLITGYLGDDAVKRLAPHYVADAAMVRETLTEGYALTRGQRLILGKITASALAAYLQRWMPIGPKTMLINVQRAIEAFEASFPDYRACGLLGALLPREEHYD